MPTSLVTGANGFAGSHMTEYLLERGHRVICLVRKTSDLTNLKELEVEYRYGDVTNAKCLPEALEGVEYVFHFAGKTKAKSAHEFLRVNAVGTKNLAEACCAENTTVKMLIYVSSLAASGPQQTDLPVDENMPPRPITVYGRSKLTGEEYVKRICGGAIRWCIVRPTAVYGPRDSDFFLYFKMISRGWKVSLEGLNPKTSMIHALDLAQVCYRAATKSPHGETYVATDGSTYTWDDLSSKIEKVMRKRAKRLTIPLWFLPAAAFYCRISAGLKGKPSILSQDKLKELRAKGWAADAGKAMDKIGYVPEFSIDDGFKHALFWYKRQGWL
ncbi:MAG: NAD-dependent epimerase/dehydratase family protein [FCB group bacterium]|nr:NAD-dependent epimerase/dehydratase family protein [FCB group bacterium]